MFKPRLTALESSRMICTINVSSEIRTRSEGVLERFYAMIVFWAAFRAANRPRRTRTKTLMTNVNRTRTRTRGSFACARTRTRTRTHTRAYAHVCARAIDVRVRVREISFSVSFSLRRCGGFSFLFISFFVHNSREAMRRGFAPNPGLRRWLFLALFGLCITQEQCRPRRHRNVAQDDTNRNIIATEIPNRKEDGSESVSEWYLCRRGGVNH